MIAASLIDAEGMASRLAAEGQFALATGDTKLASEKYAEAAIKLKSLSNAATKSPDEHLLRFLAASHFYYGGHYQKALKLARKVEKRFLPESVRPLFDPFFRDVGNRSEEGYVQRVRHQLLELWKSGRFLDLMETLKAHPFVMGRENLAFVRAILCEKIKDYRVASLFYAIALRFQPDQADILTASAALPLSLQIQDDRVDEAWEYVEFQLEHMPNAVTFMIASMMCYRRATRHQGIRIDKELLVKQVDYFERAKEAFALLPRSTQNHRDVREIMSSCFDGVILAFEKLGQQDHAKEVADLAVEFDPNSPRAWTSRGFANLSDKSSLLDFRQAIRLKHQSYLPYFCLANDLMTENRFSEAMPLIKAAIGFKMHDRIRATLFSWHAICLESLGEHPQAESFFEKAIELDGNNEEIANNYQIFKNRSVKSSSDAINFRVASIGASEIEPHLDCTIKAGEAGRSEMILRHLIAA